MGKNNIDKLKVKFLESYKNGDFLKAILTGERILKIHQENHSDESAEFVDSAFNLACVYSETGNLGRSVELLEKSSKIIKEKQGNDLKLSDIFNNMGINYNLMGKHDTALKYFKASYQIRKELLSHDNNDYCDILYI